MTYIVPVLGMGGAERHAVNLANNLDRQRFEPAIVCLGADPALLKDVALDVRVRCTGPRGAERHRRLRRFLRAVLLVPTIIVDLTLRRPDVVHSYLPAGYVVGSLAARLLSISVIIAGRLSLSPVASYSHRTLRLLADPANRVIDLQICDSEASRQVVLSSERVEAGRTVVIHSGSRVPDLSLPPPRLPESWEVRSRELAAVSIANLRWQKGHQVLLTAMAQVARSYPAFRLVLIGEGPERPRIEWLIGHLGLSGNVVLAGSVGQASKLLRNFHFSVLPSVQESFGIALVESMAAGVPVVATQVGGIPELVRHGIDGLLVEPKDPSALAEAMLRMLREPQLAAQMGVSAQRRIEESFSIEKMVRDIEGAYHSLLGSRVPNKSGDC